MILIFAYWFLVFLITSSIGIGLARLFKLQTVDVLHLTLLGGFGITILASIAAIWRNLGMYFEGFLFVLSLLMLIMFGRAYRLFLISLKAKIAQLPISLKIICLAIAFLILAQSAAGPYMIDNESYYIQTIKWLDSYGFVPGLANLHFFFSQMSGFHIFQAAINLDGIYPSFNDLSGFYLLFANLYAIFHLGAFFRTKNGSDLMIGLFPIFNIFLLQFVGAPSPDIMIYIIFLVIAGQFVKSYKFPAVGTTVLLFTLAAFAIFIKLTAILFIIFPLLLLFKLKSKFSSWWIVGSIGFLTLVLFLVKNTIITGYPLYPVIATGTFVPDFALPAALQDFYTEQTKIHGYALQIEAYENASWFDLIKRWMTLPKLHGIFNFGMCMLLIITPLFIRKNTHRKPLAFIYIITCIQMLLLWMSSPQYRYFFMYFMICMLICAASFVKRESILIIGIAMATLLAAIPLMLPLNLNNYTENKFHLELSTFSTAYLIHPHEKTKYTQAQFEPYRIGNDTLNTPTNIDFFWATGDGPLPCVQRDQVLYFAQEFGVIPQRRGPKLKDGFYSKKIADE